MPAKRPLDADPAEADAGAIGTGGVANKSIRHRLVDDDGVNATASAPWPSEADAVPATDSPAAGVPHAAHCDAAAGDPITVHTCDTLVPEIEGDDAEVDADAPSSSSVQAGTCETGDETAGWQAHEGDSVPDSSNESAADDASAVVAADAHDVQAPAPTISYECVRHQDIYMLVRVQRVRASPLDAPRVRSRCGPADSRMRT